MNMPEENQNSRAKCLEVNVTIVVCIRVENNIPKHLHSNNCIDEEEHGYQKNYIWQSLK